MYAKPLVGMRRRSSWVRVSVLDLVALSMGIGVRKNENAAVALYSSAFTADIAGKARMMKLVEVAHDDAFATAEARRHLGIDPA